MIINLLITFSKKSVFSKKTAKSVQKEAGLKIFAPSIHFRIRLFSCCIDGKQMQKPVFARNEGESSEFRSTHWLSDQDWNG